MNTNIEKEDDFDAHNFLLLENVWDGFNFMISISIYAISITPFVSCNLKLEKKETKPSYLVHAHQKKLFFYESLKNSISFYLIKNVEILVLKIFVTN